MQWLVSTIRAIPNKLGNPGGVVNIDVSLKQLTNIVKQIKLGESGYLMLMEKNGTVLVDPKQPEHNFKKLGELGDGFAELAKTGSGLVELTLNGERYMANVYPSEQLGWNFIGLIKQDEVMASATRLTWLIGIIAACWRWCSRLSGQVLPVSSCVRSTVFPLALKALPEAKAT